MLDVLILFIVSIVCYFVLHSYYREMQLAGASTPKAKRERLILWILVGVMFAGTISIFVHQNASPSMMITPLIVGVMAVLLANLKTKK